MNTTKLENDEVKSWYDKAARFPVGIYLDALFGRSTENSIYRKKAIASLNLNTNSTVLDVACGIGFNFKIIESYLQNGGKLVGVDISSESLKAAKRLIAKRKWTNIELVNMRITDYEPEILFDAILCTLALEIIPDYREAIDKIFNLLKPKGRFAMIGMKLSSQTPYKILNPYFGWLDRKTGIDVHRDIIPHIESKFKIDYYEECFLGYYYLLSASKS
ncbi:MAG: class I SAM-dependent methyltransferase [Candidatus Lokiarchaeia archaeon]